LVLVLILLTVLSAVGGAVVLLAGVETRLMALEQVRLVGRGLAEVQLERALQDLARSPDWSAVLSGGSPSSFVGGTETPEVAGWGVLDLRRQTMGLQEEVGAEWGANAPQWRLYAHGAAGDLMSDVGGDRALSYSGFYTAAWVADDEGDGDGRPFVGRNGVMVVRAEAFGPYGSRQAWVETIRRVGDGVEVVSLRVPP
jgi:hypothetical protein